MPVTTIGKEFEYFIEDQLDASGYNYESQVQASGINESWSEIDIVITYDESDTAEAVSLKYQGGPGSAEEKIPYEAESLSIMCKAHGYQRGTIVLAGEGWSKAKLYWFLYEYQPPANVRIISYDDFVRQYLTVRDIAINYAIN